MADDLTALLEQIRKRAARANRVLELGGRYVGADQAASDAPRLLDAVEAVLKLHQPGRVIILGQLCKRHENHRHFSITRTEADGVRDCTDCMATVYTSCTGCGPAVIFDACPDRLAVTRALTGKEEADAAPPQGHDRP